MASNGPLGWFDTISRDLRYALRRASKQPGFAGLAILTLGLGIGVNMAIFSVVDAVLFKPYFGVRSEPLIEVFAGDAGSRRGFSSHSYVDYLDYRAGSAEVMAGLAAFYTEPGTLKVGAASERVNVGLVSENYFSVFGIRPVAGRVFLPDENVAPGAHFVAVISEGTWQRHFGAERDLTNKAVSVNGATYAVVGVIPEGAAQMFAVAKVDVFVPAMMQGTIRGGPDWLSARGNHEFLAVGRLRPSATLAGAKVVFDSIGRQLAEAYPDQWRTRDGQPRPLTAVPASRLAFELRGYAVAFSTLVMAAAGTVLLITCSNLAGFLLAQTLERRREISVRLALGASRPRIVQQLFTEQLVLAAAGAVAGCGVALAARGLVTRLTPNLGVPLVLDVGLDARLFLFSVAMVLVATVASVLPAALQGTGAMRQAGLGTGSASTTPDRRHRRLRAGLIIGQMAVSLVLLMCGDMFIRSLSALRSVDVGFDRSRIAVVSLNLGMQGYSSQRIASFVNLASRQIEGLPEVESTSVATRLPMGQDRVRFELRASEGAVDGVDRGIAYVGFNRVGERYFETMGIPVLYGRGFEARDRGGDSTAIINDVFARWFWPGESPLGKTIRDARGGAAREIVGVVATSRYEQVNERPAPFLYLPPEIAPRSDFAVLVRTRSRPSTLLEPLRRELAAIDPAVLPFAVQTMDGHLADSLASLRAGATILGLFGALALGLASIGLYGMMAQAISQRTREFGIRVALGARSSDLRRLVLRHGLWMTVAGTTIGAILGSGASVLIAMQFYGLRTTDVSSLAGVVALQATIALAACWLPARKATTVDPMTSLRAE